MYKIEEFKHLLDFDINQKEYGYVYYLFYKDILVYIGGTENPRNRIIAHKMNKLFDRVKMMEIPIDEYKLLEINEIGRYSPIYNSVGVSKDAVRTIEIDNWLFVRRFGHIKKDELTIKSDKAYYYKDGFGYILNLQTGNTQHLIKGVAIRNIVYTVEQIDKLLTV